MLSCVIRILIDFNTVGDFSEELPSVCLEDRNAEIRDLCIRPDDEEVDLVHILDDASILIDVIHIVEIELIAVCDVRHKERCRVDACVLRNGVEHILKLLVGRLVALVAVNIIPVMQRHADKEQDRCRAEQNCKIVLGLSADVIEIEEDHVEQQADRSEDILILDVRCIAVACADDEVHDNKRHHEPEAVQLLCNERQEQQRQHHGKHEVQRILVDQQTEEICRIDDHIFDDLADAAVALDHEDAEADVGHLAAVAVCGQPSENQKHVGGAEEGRAETVPAELFALLLKEQEQTDAHDIERCILLDDADEHGHDPEQDCALAVDCVEQPHQERRKERIFVEIIEARRNDADAENIGEGHEDQGKPLVIAALCDQEHRDCAAHCEDRLRCKQRGFLRDCLVERDEQIVDIRCVDTEMRHHFVALCGCDRLH